MAPVWTAPPVAEQHSESSTGGPAPIDSEKAAVDRRKIELAIYRHAKQSRGGWTTTQLSDFDPLVPSDDYPILVDILKALNSSNLLA